MTTDSHDTHSTPPLPTPALTLLPFSGGRHVELREFALARTYAGVMEGSPAVASRHILEGVSARASSMLSTNAPLVIIRPKVMPLPEWFCVAELRSMSAARSDDPDDGSWLCVAWFVEDTTSSIEAMITAVLPQLNWEAQAADFPLF